MFKVVVGFERRLHLKASVLLNLDRGDAVAPKRPNVAFVVVPPDEVPPVAVFLEEVGVQVVVRDRVGRVLEFGVAQLHRVPRTDGLQQRSKVLRPTRVRGAFKLDELVHPVGFEVGRNGKAVRNFAQRLVELLKNGKVPELNQRVGREANGVEVVVVELHVVDAVALFRVVVSTLVPVVFNGGVVAQIRLVPHRPQVLLDGGNADVLPVASVQRVFASLAQVFLRREGLAGVGQAPIDDAVAKQGVFVGRHRSGKELGGRR